ncbi:spermidine/putrescine ABC transporter substrate-binding protein [Aquipseudomonas alcaligenes]|uniref:Spermidine/putrescine ABC transporter substrate-binding protein n=1 Tax=Aquipseudomonas alcaligenes TaxID=43263 RepID=A0A2V4LET1_AQUAC|nr:extracellular solute-binding protein [Pseudomonas alcaligenes]PYC28162.1 spermidine/putrescine ABC transporter substrate-binding protein [Pseudomonas alcaligenes]
MTFPRLLPLFSAALLSVLAPVAGGAERVLRVLAWPGYADADLVEQFEQRHDVRVEVTLVGSDDVLRRRLTRNKGADFDLIAANTAEIEHYVAEQLLQPLQPTQIANTTRQLWRFRDYPKIPGITRDGKVYAIPYTYSEMGLIYDRRQFATPPNSITSLWDPRLQGRVLAFNGSSHNFALASQARGRDPFRIAAEDFPQIGEQLIALRRNVLTFYSLPEEAASLFREHQVALLFANYGRQQLKQLRDAGADVGYVIPREGALAWLDCWAISRGARDLQLAEAWIDFTLEAPMSQALVERQGLSNTLEEPAGADVPGRLVWLRPVEDAERRARLWERILSGERPPLAEAP